MRGGVGRDSASRVAVPWERPASPTAPGQGARPPLEAEAWAAEAARASSCAPSRARACSLPPAAARAAAPAGCGLVLDGGHSGDAREVDERPSGPHRRERERATQGDEQRRRPVRAMNRVSVLGAGSERMRKCPGTPSFPRDAHVDSSLSRRSRAVN